MQYLLSEEEYGKLRQGKEAFDLKVKEAVTTEIDKRSNDFHVAFAKYIEKFIPAIPDYRLSNLLGTSNSGMSGFVNGLRPIFKILHGE